MKTIFYGYIVQRAKMSSKNIYYVGKKYYSLAYFVDALIISSLSGFIPGVNQIIFPVYFWGFIAINFTVICFERDVAKEVVIFLLHHFLSNKPFRISVPVCSFLLLIFSLFYKYGKQLYGQL